MNEAVMPPDLLERENAIRLDALEDEYESLGRALDRRGVSIDRVKDALKRFGVAIPSWGVGVGGTRFAKAKCEGKRGGGKQSCPALLSHLTSRWRGA